MITPHSISVSFLVKTALTTENKEFLYDELLPVILQNMSVLLLLQSPSFNTFSRFSIPIVPPNQL